MRSSTRMREYRRKALTHAALVLGLLLTALNAQGGVLYKWVQLVPQGDVGAQAVIRAIIGANDKCPSITIGGSEVNLKETKRSKPASGFDGIKLCESFLDSKHTKRFSKAQFSDNKNELTIPDLSKGVPLTEIIGFGCSGCRGAAPQDKCTDKDWPFWQVNEHGAKHTSDKLPPLVLHLGDIRYADQKTLPDYWSKEEVKGALAGWKEEYFDAAKPLFIQRHLDQHARQPRSLPDRQGG